MCGIIGILRFDGQQIDPFLMSNMLDKIQHRGKDHAGLVMSSDGRLSSKASIAFGHRRLSIIDLSEDSSQPMSYNNEKLWITYNGEIYNYLELRNELVLLGFTFRTNSDTEVILAAYAKWGGNCVEHFNGMFAFAIWDENKEQLFCSRDEMGIKPFYYYCSSEFIVFSSESKSLSAFHRNHLSTNGIASYMLSLYIPSDWSIFEGVKKLLPAHSLTIKTSGSMNLQRYWSVERFSNSKKKDSALSDMTSCLKSAIKLQLRSDVPVGALLSGGVDSGMLVAMASELPSNLHTYSVGFEGMEVNELAAASLVANKYKTQHHELLITDQEAIQTLDLAIQHLSEPIADPAIVPSYILSKMASEDGVKVLLSGSGGDEIFGGYTRYARGGSLKRDLLNCIPEQLKAWISYFLPPSKTRTRLQNVYLDMMFTTSGSYELCSIAMGSPNKLNKMLLDLAASFPVTKLASKQNTLYKQMLFDKSVYLPDDLLFLLDQMSMAHTIEGRVPLIDKRVVEMSFEFPPKLHVSSGRTKKLFKEIAGPYLGYEHVWRKKQGFAGPVPWWVSQNYLLFADAATSVKEIEGLQHMDISFLLSRTKKEVIGVADSYMLFILYCFRRWYDGLEK